MIELLNRFNSFFKGSAEAKIIKGRLEITIGSQTLIISLPQIIGGCGEGSSKDSSQHS